jgi:Polymer-forming cytoskeletal
MELIIRFDCCPSPWGNVADDGLTALVHMNVLDGNLLLSLAAMPVQRFQQCCICPRQFVCLIELLPPAFEWLLRKHRAPITLHCRVVAGDKLRCDHSLALIPRGQADQGVYCGGTVAFLCFRVSTFKMPERSYRLVRDEIVPIIRHGSANGLQRTFMLGGVVVNFGIARFLPRHFKRSFINELRIAVIIRPHPGPKTRPIGLSLLLFFVVIICNFAIESMSESSINAGLSGEGMRASIVRISNGAQVEGTIAAQELMISGRFKGTIQADRVLLTSSAVVEGEIHHRSLTIEENAWFAGSSRPKEASANDDVSPRSPIQLGAG